MGFQNAFGALIATPDLCRAVQTDALAALTGFDLSPREIRRLIAIVNQPGMAANCRLYRANRLTPLYRYLPRTLILLGPVALRTEIDLHWQARPETRLQHEEDVEEFVTFLTKRIASGNIADPLVADVLGLEAAACRLLFMRSRDPGSLNPPPLAFKGGNTPVRLHPHLAAVQFRREPLALLACIDSNALPPPPAPSTEHFLLLDGRTPRISVRRLPAAMGRVLVLLQAGDDRVNPGVLRHAVEAGLLIQAVQSDRDLPVSGCCARSRNSV